MEPIDIPDVLIPPHFKRFTIGEPPLQEGDPKPVQIIKPMNAVDEHKRCIALIWIPPSELEILQEQGGLFWLQIWGEHLPPFSVDVVEGVEVEGADTKTD